MTMHIAHVLQYATLLSLLMGGLGLVVAVVNHREQAKTQIFLAMSAQYNELLKSSSAGFWLDVSPGTELPEQAGDSTITMLRFCTLVSMTYLLFLERRIPGRMWELMLSSAERRFRSPFFMREWLLRPRTRCIPGNIRSLEVALRDEACLRRTGTLCPGVARGGAGTLIDIRRSRPDAM